MESLSVGVLIPVIGSIIVAALALAGTIYTARGAKDANQRAATTETWKVQIDALQARADAWREDVEQLRLDRDEDRKRLAEMEATLDAVKREAEQDRRARFELVHWARAVVALLRQHGIPFPPPPPGVADTDPGSIAVHP